MTGHEEGPVQAAFAVFALFSGLVALYFVLWMLQ